MTTSISELSRDNPRLMELEAEYARLNLFEHSAWREWQGKIDIANFRGEVGYMAQMWSMTEARYENTFDYMLHHDPYGHFIYLTEDGAFGCVTHQRMGKLYSRDLLDSVTEITFLHDVLGLSHAPVLNVLDIGAGYGRFAYRLMRSFPAFPESYIYVECVDAVPLSTFLCEFYLGYRGVENAYATPLNEGMSTQLPRFDIACNMQSFSEMPYSAVKFWLDLCADLNIRYFFLEPHAADLIHPHFVTSEVNGSNKNYYPLFAEHGYKLRAQRPKFPRELAPSLIYLTDFLLFERG